MLVLLVANLVEDEELRFGADEAGVGDARVLQMLLRFARDMTRIAREVFSGNRIDDVGDDADGRFREEGIEASGLGVWNREHVGLVNAHPAAYRRPIESKAVRERIFI